MTGQGCVITYTDNTILTATYIYTMTFDLIILALMTTKLFKISAASESYSKLRKFVFRDGLIYFIVAYVLLRSTLEVLFLMTFQLPGECTSNGQRISNHVVNLVTHIRPRLSFCSILILSCPSLPTFRPPSYQQ